MIQALHKNRARLRASRAQRRRELRSLYRHAAPRQERDDPSVLILLALVLCLAAMLAGHAIGSANRAPLICSTDASGVLLGCDRAGAPQ